MKKAGLVLLFIIISSLTIPSAKADQVLYLSFEGFSLSSGSASPGIDLSGTYQQIYSTTISLPSAKYLAGLYVEITEYSSDSTDYMSVIVYVNSQQVYSHTYISLYGTNTQKIFIPLTGHYNSTFTIRVDAKAGSAASSWEVRVDHVTTVAYFLSQNYAIKSKLTELKYVPPGADDTPEGFILNQTEVLLDQNYSLSQGTMTFWLKWDGTTNISISDNVGIDGNGHLYVKNDKGTIYTLDGVSLPAGKYVPVYIGWRDSEGYIMINTTKLMLNWNGNLILSRIGDMNQESATIIDEFKLWNTYIPPDQVIYESQKEGYTLLWKGQVIIITPEGGTSLGNLDVSFLTANLTTINSTILSPGQKTATVPNNTALITISRSGISRRYWLGNYTKIAFPAESVQLVSSTISIRPTIWQYLTLKTPDGRVATRVKLDSTQTASVMAVLGSDYIISLENGNTTKSMLYTITGDISLWVENDTAKYQGKYFTAQLDDNNKLLIITYYDQSAETKELHISIRAYDANNNLKYGIKDIAVEGPVAYYRLALPVANDTDVMLYKVTIDADGHIYERTVFGEADGGSVLPSNIVPSGLVIFGAGVVGALMFVAINAYLMPFGALIALSAVKFLGWANVSPSVLGMLGVFSALAMLMYRRDQGVG